jgi:pilus assembly protein CpaE
MSAEITALVALDDEVDRGVIETVLTRDPRVKVIDYLDIAGPAASRLGAGDALIVAVAEYSAKVREFVATASRQHPLRPIVLMCPPTGNGYLGDAFGNGVDDIVALPTESSLGVDPTLARQLVFALEKALMRKRGTAAPKADAARNAICVLGLKGGSGKTLTATNLAVTLAQAGRSVAIMDLDLQFGDVALAMGLNPVRTMYDLVRSGGSLDAEKLEDFMVDHASGARALLAPVRPDQAAVISVPFLAEVQNLLAEVFEFVVFDTPASFSAEVISAVDCSTDILVVAMRDTLSLKNTKLGLETLEQMEYDRRRVKVLLNRANTNVGIERDDVLAILGRDVDVLLPSDREITRSMNQGSPIALQRGSAAGVVFRSIAQMYMDASLGQKADAPIVELDDPQPAPSRRSLFRRPAGSL